MLSPLDGGWWGHGIAHAFTHCMMKKKKIYIYIYINSLGTPLTRPSAIYVLWWKQEAGNIHVYKNKIYIYIYKVHMISFQTFFVWALLLIVHTWNSSPLQVYLLQLQCTSCTVPTTSGRPHGSPLVWACQWPSSQFLSSPQLFHNDSLWA